MQELWHSYLSHMQERNLIVEGPLTALKPSLMPLAIPERRFDRRAFSLGTRFSNRCASLCICSTIFASGRVVPSNVAGIVYRAGAPFWVCQTLCTILGVSDRKVFFF